MLFGNGKLDAESVALRTSQVRQTISKGMVTSVATGVAALAIVVDAMRDYPLWMSAAYLCLTAALIVARQLSGERRAEGFIHAVDGYVAREFIVGFLSAVVLAAPLLAFAVQGDLQRATAAWLIFSVFMAIYGLNKYTISLLCVTLFAPLGVFASATFFYLGAIGSGVAVLVFTAVTHVIIFRSSRTFVTLFLTRRRAEESGETVSLLLREFEEAEADWLWQVDNNRRIVRPSPRFAHAVGKEAEDIEGVGLLQMLAGDHWQSGKFPPALHELANKLNRKESFSNLIVPVAIGNRAMWWELSASPAFDGAGNFVGFRGVGSDVTEQRMSADRIAHLARFDALTSLPNRLFLNEALAEALEQAATWRRRCAFMMIDLDRFKSVNDTLGHPVGDRLLEHVAGRIRALCGDAAIAGRLGGDEFGVVLREITNTDTIERLGERIIEAVSRPYEIDHHTLYVGASIGYAIGPRDGATVEALTRNADLALYRSKDKGGGLINGYEPAMHDQARERREIEIELRSALGNDEFEVVYQPVVHSDGRVDGFEALLRWHNAKLGHVSPVKFIPVAEDTRLIGAIGEWVLQTACRQALEWPGSTKVAVNVSAEQLIQPNFVGSVVNALARSGLPPHRLELEVTESVFLREGSGAMQTLDQVRALGVRLSLDDFGTGYSSLGYLRMGQFSTIKVDRSFVQGALKGASESIAIIRAVVALADSLSMSTTAEGVETQDEADAIIKLGCKKLQGYHFGRPMSAVDASAIFSKHATIARQNAA
ncbi:MAG: EAL domain-containing protein [Sphingopyxis sp.]|nr:EAL domain-containing protein [Sphingopyxis sp.]